MLDSDDVLTPTALEEMYNAAEEFDADYVHTERHYVSAGKDTIEPDKFPLRIRQTDSIVRGSKHVDKPTVENFDLAERIRRYRDGRYFGYVWGKLFRRDLFVEYDLKFPQLKTSDDMVVVFYCLCVAKRIVRVPTLPLIYRLNPTSLVHSNPTPEKILHKAILNTAGGLKVILEFMSKLDFFNQNPEYKYLAIDFYVQDHLAQFDLRGLYSKAKPFELNDILIREFDAIDRGYNLELMSYLWSLANNYRREINDQRKTIDDCRKQIKSLQDQLKQAEQNKMSYF